jgi:tRNA-binding EMAP/Myf-like protein
LYCEDIDVGEDEPRKIASGLREYYSLEEMQGRTILVMCNLKARNLVGFKSHGMVCCAKSGDKVEFVDPPAGAIIGERVKWEGLDEKYEPVTPAQVDKKKVILAAMPVCPHPASDWQFSAHCMLLPSKDFKTDGNRVANWQGHACTTSAGPVVAPTLADAPIS